MADARTLLEADPAEVPVPVPPAALPAVWVAWLEVAALDEAEVEAAAPTPADEPALCEPPDTVVAVEVLLKSKAGMAERAAAALSDGSALGEPDGIGLAELVVNGLGDALPKGVAIDLPNVPGAPKVFAPVPVLCPLDPAVRGKRVSEAPLNTTEVALLIAPTTTSRGFAVATALGVEPPTADPFLLNELPGAAAEEATFVPAP